MKNKYLKRAHISERKFREVVKYFTADLTVSEIVKLSCISRRTSHKIIKKIRCRIYDLCLKEKQKYMYR